MRTIIAEMRAILGEAPCPPGKTWDPKLGKCVPQPVYGTAILGFRAGRRGWGGSRGGFGGGGGFRGGGGGGGGHR